MLLNANLVFPAVQWSADVTGQTGYSSSSTRLRVLWVNNVIEE